MTPNSDRRSNRGLRARVRYWFDSGMSRGPIVVIGWLLLLTLAVILVAATIDTMFGFIGLNDSEEGSNFFESMWQSLLRALDPGTFAEDVQWSSRFLGLTITVIGILLAGSLIGLIANLVDQKVDSLRKGRSSVIESGHTLILGWSSRVPVIARELALANESGRRTAVVVLADADKTEMEDAIGDEVSRSRTTRFVCRSGNTNLPADLDLVNVTGARSIIVTGESDASVIKTLLAVRSLDPDFTSAHVVAEVNSNESAESIRTLFGPRVATVDSDTVVAELTAQACRQRGLASVFRELLSFAGNEIYFGSFPQLTGRTYGEAQLAFDTSSVIGRLRTDGIVELNPPADAVITEGEELIAVAGDDTTFLVSSHRRAAPGAPARTAADDQAVSLIGAGRVLVVGWSALGPRVLQELDDFVRDDTVIEVVADPRLVDVPAIESSVTLKRAGVHVHPILPGGPEQVAKLALDGPVTEVIVIGYRDHLDTEDADARTLLALMAFDKVAADHGFDSIRVVAELLDHRNAPLALATGVDDFVVSDELASLLIGQLSERLELTQVFDDLFRHEGCVIELRPVSAYGTDRLETFEDAVRVAAVHGHSAFGFQRASDREPTLNPDKSEPLALVPDDLVLVVRHTS